MAGDKTTKIEELKELLREFRDERNWQQYHTPKDLAEAIIIEAGELLELVLWKKTKETLKMHENGESKERLREELADVVIYCLNFADVTDIDISEAVEDKIKKNSQKYPID